MSEMVQDPWQQIADTRPFLHNHVRIFEHQYRHATWYVISNSLAASYFRCDEFSKLFLEQLNSVKTVGEAFDAARVQLPDLAPDTAEIIRLLAALREADMLAGLPEVEEQGAATSAGTAKKPSPWLQAMLRPLAVKIPLVDPDKWLGWLAPRSKAVFGVPAIALACVLAVWASLLAMSRWPELVVHFESRFMDWGNVLLLWFIYPLLKGAHELGHGLVARRWGAEVHEMGLMFLVLMPVPYVDASSSSTFANKYQRMAVAAAGIVVELLLSSIALIAWVWLEPGTLRDAMFNVAFIGGISTLLFNGNPLLRFDGYYVFCDAIEIPNLGTRSNQYLAYLFKRYAVGISGAKTPVSSRGERRWFISYGIAAFIYRLFISFTIALYIVGKFFIFGIVLTVWMLFLQFVMPLIKGLKKIAPEVAAQAKSTRMKAVCAGIAASVYLLFFVIPLPHSTHVAGVIELGDRAPVRSGADGFIAHIIAHDGQKVSEGDILLKLEEPGLQSRLQLAKARLYELKVRHQSLLVADLNAAAQVVDEIRGARAEYEDLERQSRSLEIKAQRDGWLSLGSAADLPGRFVKQGDLLGHVVDLRQVRVRVAVEQNDVDDVRRHTKRVEARLQSQPFKSVASNSVSEVPMATNALPSPLLGSKYGGRIPVDARDEQGLKAIYEVFQFDVELPALSQDAYLGKLAELRFVHTEQAVGIRLWRHLQLLLTRQLAG
ncbi:MAG: biotin/lipoyl-binding protein [Pseudomonadales bacterium]|nr:biotin/lipoyl-binding protein [Pseudomonadales bacterium]